MKNRMRKKNLDSRCKLSRQFVKDTLRALAEARAGKPTPYEYGPGTLQKITLFLDFDGVLHPFLARSSAEAFCHLPRLERVLREFPAVQIVIASTQRESVPLTHLAQRFSPDIAARIVGITPVLEVRDAGDVAGSWSAIDVYRRFTCVDHASQPSLIPGQAPRVASRLTTLLATTLLCSVHCPPSFTPRDYSRRMSG